MDQASRILRGTLLPDGTLELADRPSLPAGPVEVTIRSVPVQTEAGDWFDYLQRARAELEASGYPFPTEQEIDADIEEMRSGGEDRVDEIHRQAGTDRPRDEPAG